MNHPKQRSRRRQKPPASRSEGETRESGSVEQSPTRISDPRSSQDGLRMLHTWLTGGSVYGIALSAGVGLSVHGEPLSVMTAEKHAEDTLKRMRCKDPLEEMLVMQALWAHARAAHLTMVANQQKELTQVRVVNEYADRASNTFRRLMLALADYRCPRRSGDSFVAIKAGQANIAHQQVITPVVADENQNVTNEKGLHHVKSDVAAPAPVLPLVSEGPGLTPSEHPSRKTLEPDERSCD